MEKKKVVIYFTAFIVFALFLFVLFYNNTLVSNKSLGASVETVKKDTDSDAVLAAKRYVSYNISKYDGVVELSIDYLKKVGYMTGDEIYEKTGLPFGDDLRVSVFVQNNEVIDAFLKNIPFNVLYECNDICYVNRDNYIAINGKVYRILKIDYNNTVYIVENKYIKSKSNLIDSTLSNYYNDNYDNVFKNVISITYADLISSTFINKEDNLVVNTGEGYKLYNVISEATEEMNNDYVNIVPVIMLNEDVMYENGTGTSMDPFIINE